MKKLDYLAILVGLLITAVLFIALPPLIKAANEDTRNQWMVGCITAQRIHRGVERNQAVHNCIEEYEWQQRMRQNGWKP